MSEEEKNASDAGTGTAMETEPAGQPFDEHTTEPNAPQQPPEKTVQPPGKWEMPKPKFQQTSGYLPQGYLKDLGQGSAPNSERGNEDTTQEQPAFVPDANQEIPAAAPKAPAIEPQPDLTEQLIDEPAVVPAAAPTTAKSGSSAPMIVLGLIGILIFVAIFLAAVYFLFLAKPAAGNNF